MNLSEVNDRPVLYVAFGIVFVPAFFNGFYLGGVIGDPLLYWFIEFVSWIVLPSLGLYLIISRSSFGLQDIGFRMPRGSIEISAVLVSIPLVLILDRPIHDDAWYFASTIFDDNFMHQGYDYKQVVPATGIMSVLVGAYFSLSAGIVEEVYYRGVLRKFWGDGAVSVFSYILMSAFLFSIIHWESGIYNVFATFIIGVLMASLYSYTKNIAPCIIGHSFSNWIYYSS